MKTHLRFVGDIVRKTGDSSSLKVECEKTARAQELGEESGLFLTPKVIRFDAGDGEFEMVRLSGLRSLDQLLDDSDPRLPSAVGKAGCALAAVHAGLRLPADLRRELPGDWNASRVPTACLHGDFTLANVFLQEPTERLVILDWASAPTLEELVTVGPVWFDIHWFLYYLYQSMPLRPGQRARAAELAEVFCEGYLSRDEIGVTAQVIESERNRITPFLQALVFKRTGGKPWHKKGPFLLKQLLAYSRWRRFTPSARLERS